MGDVVSLRPRLRSSRHRDEEASRSPSTAEIVLFTGVRVEYWAEGSPDRGNGSAGPEIRPPGGRRRRRSRP